MPATQTTAAAFRGRRRRARKRQVPAGLNSDGGGDIHKSSATGGETPRCLREGPQVSQALRSKSMHAHKMHVQIYAAPMLPMFILSRTSASCVSLWISRLLLIIISHTPVCPGGLTSVPSYSIILCVPVV